MSEGNLAPFALSLDVLKAGAAYAENVFVREDASVSVLQLCAFKHHAARPASPSVAAEDTVVSEADASALARGKIQ